MAEDRVQRKLTTILAADVEGYSRLMSADEETTLKTLKRIFPGSRRLLKASTKLCKLRYPKCRSFTPNNPPATT